MKQFYITNNCKGFDSDRNIVSLAADTEVDFVDLVSGGYPIPHGYDPTEGGCAVALNGKEIYVAACFVDCHDK